LNPNLRERRIENMPRATIIKEVVVATIAFLVLGIPIVVVLWKEPGNEYRGTFKLIFPMALAGHQTNLYSMRLLSNPPYWKLSLTSSNENHEVLASPNQTFEVDLYDAPPAGPRNTCEISVIPGPRPLLDRKGEHIWLALLSNETCRNARLPLPGPPLGMFEPTVIYAIKDLSGNASPRQMNWTNRYSDGRKIRIEGEFKWLASGNRVEGLRIPTSSQMTMYLVRTNGNRQITSRSELVIESVTPLTAKFDIIPKVPGRNVVHDYRKCDLTKSIKRYEVKQYDVQNGEGLGTIPVTTD
jgi:hypothetical protein